MTPVQTPKRPKDQFARSATGFIAPGVILVAAAGTTTKPRLADAVQRIEAADSRVLGTVVTMLPTTGADKTAYGTYAYGTQRATA